MDDEKQLLKYLSWLDDLGQDFIFNDNGNVLTIKMDQVDMTGQPNVDNTLQYDQNMSNFDYSDRVMPYNVNETLLTGTMTDSQPNVMPDSYSYNNFLPNDGFYADASLDQPHVPVRPPEQPFCTDMNDAVRSDNSYVSTAEPQLCMDIAANPASLNTLHESNQYSLPEDVEIKDEIFHEEKHVVNDVTNGQLPMNSVTEDVNASANNDFSQINSHSELNCGDTSLEPMNIDHGIVEEKPFVDTVQNLNENSESKVLESPIEIHDSADVNTKEESSNEVKTEFKHEEIDLDTSQEQMTASVPVEPSDNVIKDETVTQQSTVENEKVDDSASHPVANGVDKISIDDELCDIQMCIRNGCANRAINNPEWEQEFCSNECVIIHCKNVFTAWVKTNEIAS